MKANEGLVSTDEPCEVHPAAMQVHPAWGAPLCCHIQHTMYPSVQHTLRPAPEKVMAQGSAFRALHSGLQAQGQGSRLDHSHACTTRHVSMAHAPTVM